MDRHPSPPIAIHRHPSPSITTHRHPSPTASPPVAIDRHWSPSIATGRHPSPTAVCEPRSHPASLARGFDLPLHATRPARTMFAATSAAGVMLQRTRLVSSEPLVMNVSSNGAFWGARSVATDARARASRCPPTASWTRNHPVGQYHRCGQRVPPNHAACNSAPHTPFSRTRSCAIAEIVFSAPK